MTALRDPTQGRHGGCNSNFAIRSARRRSPQTVPLMSLGHRSWRGRAMLRRPASGGPFVVEHREPGRIAVAILDDHVLAEDAFKGKAQAQGGAAAGLVFRVALPLVAAVAQVFEDVPGHQVHGFSGGRGALQRRRQQDVADLDHAVCRIDAHVAGVAPRRIRSLRTRSQETAHSWQPASLRSPAAGPPRLCMVRPLAMSTARRGP